MKYYEDASQVIGKTPLVRINRLNPYPEITILVKLEQLNPGGSVKDRIAKFMIEDAERRGVLTKEKVVIEATSGNTGIGLAMICAIKGYSCELVMPESMSIERRKIMQAYGATVTLTPAKDGIDSSQDYVTKLLSADPDKYYSPNQYDNPVNWKAHFETTAKEILGDTENRVTHFVAGLGTSGTLMGVGRGLKQDLPDVQIVSVEPEENRSIPGLKDLKTQYIPRIFDDRVLQKRIYVDEFSAERMTRNLALDEGLFVGQSAGAAMEGALRLARDLHEEGEEDAVIVVLFADSGEKYMSTNLFAASEVTEYISDSMKGTIF
ncbi:MAG: PLP-dependent cysteine synthase family protein [Candidatus Thorarchaeota archaeon]